MITDIIAWVWTLFLLSAPYPLTVRLIPDGGIGLRAAATIALGAGGLSLVMLWEGLLGVQFLPIGIAIPYLLIIGTAFFNAESAETQRNAEIMRGKFILRFSISLSFLRDSLRTLRSLRFNLFSLFILPIIAAIAFNAGYWAFHRDDAIHIYQPQAAEIARTRALIPLTGADSLYRAYPMQMQLLYAHAYLLSGWENDYLAQFISALIALGCIPAAYALAERLRAGSGGIAAFLLATTPTFGAWASSGYVDLPTAFTYTLSAVFALRLWDNQRRTDAALTGIMLGLAAWTKNAALVGVPLLIVWLAWAWMQRRIRLKHIVIALIGCALVAAPYYVRNLIGAGFVIPDTAWTDQAERTLESALIFVTHPEIYGVTGWLMVGGIAHALGQMINAKTQRRKDARKIFNFAPWCLRVFALNPLSFTVLLWTLPFFAVWWIFASYDPRFLLVILPILGALSGLFAVRLWEWTVVRLGTRRRFAEIALLVVAVLLTARAIWFSVEYKDEIARNPFMSDAEKRVIVGRDAIPPES